MDNVAAASDEIRRIVNNGAPTRFARGWHCLGQAGNFLTRESTPLRVFGQEIAIDQRADGELFASNERCPLKIGRAAGTRHETVAPSCNVHVTQGAASRALAPCWPVLQQDGLLFIWNDAEGAPPRADQTIPRIHGSDPGQWTDLAWNEINLKADPRDVIEHLVDTATFFYESTNRPTFFKNVFEDHVATQYFDGPMRREYSRHATEDAPEHLIWTNSVASYFGPSFMIDELDYVHDRYDTNAVLITAHYPVDEHNLVLFCGVSVKRSKDLGLDPQEFAADQSARILHGFGTDAEIWQQKTRVDNPLLCEEDGPVYQMRRWYEQFFCDVAAVEPQMTDRFEYEMDTTMPVDMWKRTLARIPVSRVTTGKQPA
ncbi:3-ketosteroid-9-alpha-hydroxylase [Arthrobacter sp. AQ5-05]|uniref:3-ketosteroid-9-alpha-hydroxylase n=1 Tax=Arthrobacter sp. AQ5-05 TaxID=2184581 RepID=UPI000DCE40FA|nr:3-ketosteroid-9-alpha-hydroxylase [Arthrobacter sp. AQ5-05]RAX45956.1 3-ketosteroid-9-alpha-hydroxylase [Arthrobacter sp. AQ5-05]